MGKSNKWCIIQQECDQQFEFYLNVGDTTIGRNKVADVIIKSNICSRNHCVITLDSNENIFIKNKVIAYVISITKYIFTISWKIF